MAKVYDLNGKAVRDVDSPRQFASEVKPELIKRAVLAESSYNLQPKGHFVLAGMQTTARYYGAMNEYRSGRHMGVAIRPKEKLGGGRQGKVRRIPSAVTGKRAHPHKVGKIIRENMNRQEYQRALGSCIAASRDVSSVFDDSIESVKRTKEIVKAFAAAKLDEALSYGRRKRVKKGLRRNVTRRHYRKSVLLVLNNDSGAIKAARNLPGVDAVTLKQLTASAFAPGGNPGRKVVYSESALKNLDSAVSEASLQRQYKYFKELSI